MRGSRSTKVARKNGISVTCDVWETMGREQKKFTLQLCAPFVSSGQILLVFLC